MCDNPVLRVSGNDLERLKVAMALTDRKTAVGFNVSDSRLTFFSSDHDMMTKFPCPLDMDTCAILAMQWLKTRAVFPREPDHDGDNERGWLCLREEWGEIRPFGFQAFIAVEPYWEMFGK